MIDALHEKNWFWIFSAVMIACLLASVILLEPLIAYVPILVVGAYFILQDFRNLFYVLILSIPLSTEVVLGGGIGMDFPSEPVMLLTLGLLLFVLALKPFSLDRSFIKHPIFFLLFLHWLWVFVAAIFASDLVIALKFWGAKTWYYACFVFMASIVLKSDKAKKISFWLLFVPLTLTILLVLFKIAATGFDFALVNKQMHPFFRNKVVFGLYPTIFLPFAILATGWYRNKPVLKWIIYAGIVILALGAIWSFTRAAHVGLAIILVGAVIIHFKLLRWLIAITMLVVAFALTQYLQKDNYLKLAPDYSKTIEHKNFEDLMSATFKGQDVSSMERVYRWIAAFRMSDEKPITGFGPGNFYSFYKSYTVSAFRTYVSQNPEKSSTHNYYLMVLVEQGFVGFLIFLILCIYVILRAERLYHILGKHPDRYIVLACLISLLIQLFALLLNDMIELDKTGSLFFLSITILILVDIKHKKSIEATS